MRKIKILSDSTLDIQPDLAKEFDITIIPLSVNFGINEVYQDGVNITTEELYKKVEEKNMLPKTVAITPGEIYKIFQQYVDEGYDVLYTGIGGKFSSSHNNAVQAAKMIEGDHIEVVDSANLSTGITLSLLKACKARDEGLDIHQVAQKMREAVPLVKAQFAVNTMEYLYKGGRCSSIAKLFGTILKIKPIIAVRDGAMSVLHKPRGKMVIALDKQLEMLQEAGSNVDPDAIFVTHSIAPEEAKYLLPKIKAMHPEARVIETRANSIVSTHCGPGTIGILWLSKE